MEESGVPAFISQAPWYTESQKPKPQKPKPGLDHWYKRGFKLATKTNKFRKGACINCGAITHKAKDCCERPRKVGAKYTGTNLMPDEYLQEIEHNYESKRDRWNGFDSDMYDEVLDQYQSIENARKARKLEEIKAKLYTEDGELSEEEPEYAHSELVNKEDPRTKTIIGNNRIREDRAVYLKNLDDSVNYDGKSRSLIEDTSQENNQIFRDSWVRVTGDMEKFQDQESYVLEMNKRGHDLHSLANPSQSELLYKHYKTKSQELTNKKKEVLEDKYGKQSDHEDFL